MHECHAHMALDGSDWKQALARHEHGADEAWIRSVLQRYADAGVTYVRDGGDKFGASLLAQRLAGEYGITYVSPAWPLSQEGTYGSFIGKTYADMREYRQRVDEAIEAGARFIKLMTSGILSFDEFGVLTSQPRPAEQVAEMVAVAHEVGLPVMIHANGDEAVSAAVAAGAESVEHGYYMSAKTRRMLAESNTVWVPTLAPICNLIGTGRFPDAVLERIAASQREAIAEVVSLGGRIACGSDAGAACVPHARGALDELSLLGETPLQGNEVIARVFA